MCIYYIFKSCCSLFREENNLRNNGNNQIELSNSFNDLVNNYDNNEGNNSLIGNN